MKESQLENKTAIATNDYVRMVDENGNSVKIKKDSFMAAIRDALPSIISDGATGGGSVLSIINGALKTRTDANLASVLGGELKYQKKQFVRSGGSETYARIYFTNSGSTSSSADILCTVQPMNSNGVYTSIIYAYKYIQTNISGVSVKKIISYGGNTAAVYFKEQYVYVKCHTWNTMALEVLNSDTTSVVIDTVDSLPSDCSEASEIQ